MEDFAELGQKIHRRRSKLNYKSFDEFSSDSEEDLLANVTLDSNYHLGASGKSVSTSPLLSFELERSRSELLTEESVDTTIRREPS